MDGSMQMYMMNNGMMEMIGCVVGCVIFAIILFTILIIQLVVQIKILKEVRAHKECNHGPTHKTEKILR